MKRFLVFRFECHYPSGGIGDLHGAFDDADEAYRAAANIWPYDFYPLWDAVTGKLRKFVRVDGSETVCEEAT